MAGRNNKELQKYMEERFVNKLLDESEDGRSLKEVLGEKSEWFREYMYDAYPRLGNIGLGAFVALFYEDGYIYPKRKRMSEEFPEEWAKIRKFIFERDNYTCVYCGKRGTQLEVDHKIPFIHGGSDDVENLLTACVTCNRQKRDKSYEEFMKWRKKNGGKTKKAY